MKEEYYRIFASCFPNMQLSYERFCNLLVRDKCVYLEECEDDEVCAFAILYDFAIRLICVKPEKQGHGIGTRLLARIEAYACKQGFEKVITGGVSSRLFIGAPSESFPFFEKRGFVSHGCCDEMLLKLENFCLDQLSLHGGDLAEYGWFEGDIEEIQTAVSLVDESWVQYFSNLSHIYVARVKGEIASFCLVDVNCQNYLTDQYGKVGMPGCVGTVPKYRNKGIGLEMVANVTEYLKEQGMDISFIFFTGVADWYEKIGYEVFLTECFGEKRLQE